MNHIAGSAEFAAAFGVSRETLARLQVYADLLLRWQATINLVAPATLPDLWHRHFADSAQLLRLAAKGPLNWLDLGSGAGFPGLVVAQMLAERPGSRVTLIESDNRKGAFLREVTRQTGLSGLLRVDIVTERIEKRANTPTIGAPNIVSARALAPLSRLLGWCQPYFGDDTVALLPKGRDVEVELAEARRSWSFQAELMPSLTDADGRILKLARLVSI